MSEKDFETQEAIQEQSPTAARFENNDLSFDELSTMIGSTFVDIANGSFCQRHQKFAGRRIAIEHNHQGVLGDVYQRSQVTVCVVRHDAVLRQHDAVIQPKLVIVGFKDWRARTQRIQNSLDFSVQVDGSSGAVHSLGGEDNGVLNTKFLHHLQVAGDGLVRPAILIGLDDLEIVIGDVGVWAFAIIDGVGVSSDGAVLSEGELQAHSRHLVALDDIPEEDSGAYGRQLVYVANKDDFRLILVNGAK